jgi:hypothetical protein
VVEFVGDACGLALVEEGFPTVQPTHKSRRAFGFEQSRCGAQMLLGVVPSTTWRLVPKCSAA